MSRNLLLLYTQPVGLGPLAQHLTTGVEHTADILADVRAFFFWSKADEVQGLANDTRCEHWSVETQRNKKILFIVSGANVGTPDGTTWRANRNERKLCTGYVDTGGFQIWLVLHKEIRHERESRRPDDETAGEAEGRTTHGHHGLSFALVERPLENPAWMEPTPSIPSSCVQKSSVTWSCKTTLAYNSMRMSTLHFMMLERSVVDPLTSLPVNLQEQHFRETEMFSADGDDVYV